MFKLASSSETSGDLSSCTLSNFLRMLACVAALLLRVARFLISPTSRRSSVRPVLQFRLAMAMGVGRTD